MEEVSVRDALKSLSSRYAAMLFIIPANYLLSAYIFFLPASLILAAVTGSGAIDSNTGSGYTLTFVLNALMSYTIPMLAAALLFGKFIEKGGTDAGDEGYRRFPLDTVMLYFAGLFLASTGSIVTNFVSEQLNSLYGTPEPEQAFSDLMPTSLYTFAVIAINTIIVAPLCEELIYRHFLLKPLRKYGDAAAVVVSAMLFSISHYNFDQMLYTFFFGAFLGIIVVRSDSVIPALICHAVNNLTAVLQSYLPETFGSEAADSFFGALSGGARAFALLAYYTGAVAALAAVLMKMLRMKDRCELAVRTQFAVIFGSPGVIIGIAASFGLTVLLLYS